MKKLFQVLSILTLLLFLATANSKVTKADSEVITRTQYDPSYSVKSTQTIYFETVPTSGARLYKLTKVTGKIDVLDHSVQVTGATGTIGQNGTCSKKVFCEQHKNFSTNKMTYTVYPEKSWKPVGLGVKAGSFTYSQLGASITVKIKRGKSTWKFTQSNARLN